MVLGKFHSMSVQFQSMFRKGLILLNVGCLSALLPVAAIAQQQTYPLSTRASFMQGCLIEDDKPTKPVTEEQIKFCLCMMDLLQSKYPLERFIKLSEAYDKKQPQAQTELEKFFKDNMNTCL
jgi:hypothetical protein